MTHLPWQRNSGQTKWKMNADAAAACRCCLPHCAAARLRVEIRASDACANFRRLVKLVSAHTKRAPTERESTEREDSSRRSGTSSVQHCCCFLEISKSKSKCRATGRDRVRGRGALTATPLRFKFKALPRPKELLLLLLLLCVR